MNGSGSMWLAPSALTWRSSIASSSADCVFGEARLISSASTMLANSGPGWKTNDSLDALEDADADEVGRQQVGRELHALPRAVDRGRHRLGEAGLADAGHVLDEQVSFGEQAHDGQLDGVLLAVHDTSDVARDGIEERREGTGRS